MNLMNLMILIRLTLIRSVSQSHPAQVYKTNRSHSAGVSEVLMMSVMSNNEFSCFDDNLFSHEKKWIGFVGENLNRKPELFSHEDHGAFL